MSEFFEQGAGIKSHLEGVRQQVEALHSRTDIPQGDHIDIVLGMADIGGEYSGVLLQGDQGSGKTSLMNAILGEASVIGVDPGDDVPMLLGFEKPTGDKSVYAAGKIGELVMRSGGDIRIGLDELGHLENARPLHRLFNGTGFSIHNGTKRFETSSMALIASTNYVNKKGGVYPIHKELRSRFGGGIPLESPEIPSPGKRTNESGILAPTKVRQDIREYMERMHPEHASANVFTNQLVTEIAKTGLFEPIPADARIMGGLLQVVRAKRLVMDDKLIIQGKSRILTSSDGRNIHSGDIVDVAAFNLGKTAELNRQGLAVFSNALGGQVISEHLKAVIQNRFVAGIAKKTELMNMDPVKRNMTAAEIEDAVKNHIKETSYATSMDLQMRVNDISKEDVLDQAIVNMLFSKKTLEPEVEVKEDDGNVFKRALAKFRTR